MGKVGGIGVSAVALSVALGGGTAAFAVEGPARVVTTNIADYNAAQVKTANGILTVPAGVATYQVNSGSLEINSRFTVTLPSGFTFSSQPSLNTTATTSFTLLIGGIGAQSATFVVGPAPVTSGNNATLNSFSIQGATALEVPIPVAGALPISLQSTNNAQVNNNDRAPLSKGAFAAEPGITDVFVGAIQFIDLAPPSLGTEFFSSPDSLTAVLSASAAQAQTVDAATSSVPVLGATGNPNSLSTSDTYTLTMGGLFNGVKSAFVSSTSDCQNPVPGTAGIVAPLQETFTGVPLNTEEFFCETSAGTTLLQQNQQGATNVGVSPGTSTDFLGAASNVEFPGLFTYTGGGVISVTNFFTGDDAGYSSLLRVNNAATGSVTLFPLVQPDTGGPQLVGSLGSLGAGVGTLFTEAQIVAAVPGLSLANSGQRATINLVVTGNFGAVSAASLLVNPTGTVTEVGEQPNQQPQ